MSKGLVQLSRELLVQAIYQQLITDTSEKDLIKENKEKLASVNKSHFKRVLHYYFENKLNLEELIVQSTSRPIKKIDIIDQSILFLALAESASCETPKKVIINEAVELSRIYGPEDSYRFINGALDNLKTSEGEKSN
jgi:N utilization substance protein B